MWKVLRHADVDVDQLESRTGGVVYVDDMDDIEPLRFDNVTGQAYEEAGTNTEGYGQYIWCV